MRWTRHAFLGALGVAAMATAACGDVELRSQYRDGNVVVDGDYADWDGKLTWVEETDMSVGVQNDDRDLYVILVVGDRDVQRKIMMSGMFLWFDAAGARDRQFGIHYPLGLADPTRFIRAEPGGDVDREKMREEYAENSLAEVELIAAAGQMRITRSPDNLPGIAVAAKQDRGAMVFEYRIPLPATVASPYGVGAAPGTSIGVGLMTPEIDMSAMRERMRERGGGGVRGGGMGGGRRGGGMGGGPRGGMRGGGPPEAPEPIHLWATLVLATGDSN